MPSPRVRTGKMLAVSLCGLVLLAGCSTPPDAETTRDALTEVTETPEETQQQDQQALYAEIDVDPQECAPYLVVTVRGTGEPQIGQLLSPVVREIEDARPDAVEVMHLDYPASTEMKKGSSIGVFTLVQTLNLQVTECPLQRFVLLGYSQGALVIGDALSATADRIVGSGAGELTGAASDRIAAIVFYGNPRFVGSEPYNRGFFNPDINGLLARPVGALDTYAERMNDFCVRRDFVCQSTMSLDEDGHVQYFDNGMQEEGAEFVIDQLVPLPGDGARERLTESEADSD